MRGKLKRHLKRLMECHIMVRYLKWMLLIIVKVEKLGLLIVICVSNAIKVGIGINFKLIFYRARDCPNGRSSPRRSRRYSNSRSRLIIYLHIYRRHRRRSDSRSYSSHSSSRSRRRNRNYRNKRKHSRSPKR